ncbi:MFS transporter [Hirschia baltica]|uniref:D-galactonate transporter n=1 Tax=Hirschia baltica (strain ATCC 49814 / DSM 5838 / IFAM 1418) TaxID=582402 RepID=C6XP01_HIRBI|nr:MFS transporter [Hirschia baltica]ACT60181.1 d-galactonate transporter [Hirschia baltica ATCC 49814]
MIKADLKPTRVRFLIIALIFIITTINYADRASFAIAGDAASSDLGLNSVQLGFILSAFAWAYVAAQIPGGALLDKFGTRLVYTIAIAMWSLFTFFQGFVGFFVGGTAFAILFALRMLVGLCEAPSFPGNARVVSNWFPNSERGTASAIFNSAQYFSLVVFAPFMAWLVHSFGWSSVFFVMGGLGLVAAFVFWKFIRSPVEHNWVNEAEVNYIEDGGGITGLDSSAGSKSADFNWHNVRQVLGSRMLVGIFIGQYGINVLTYFFVTWFPIYLVQERGMDILKAGFATAIPALCGFAGGVLGGVISDALLRKTGSATIARKTPLLIGMAMACSIMACTVVDAEWMIIAFMALAFFGKGMGSLGWAIISDTSPKEFVGVTGGIFNTCGNTAGIVTPIVIGFLVGNSGNFDNALIFVGVHSVLVMIAYLVIVQKIERLTLLPKTPPQVQEAG